MIDRLVFPSLRALGWVAVIYAAMMVGPEIEGKLFPVIDHFKVTYTLAQGDDTLVAGTLRKGRACNWIEPWRAKTIQTNRALQIITPPNDSTNWPVGEIEFAPIIVVATRGEAFELWAEHECHPLWHTMTYLGLAK